MARRILSYTSFQPTAAGVADGATYTSGAYMALQGANATQLTNLWEVSISGQAASSSSPTFLILAYDSTIGVTGGSRAAGLTDVPMNPATAALTAPVVTNNTWTTNPQRSASHLGNMSLNAFGGVYFWRANRTEECFTMLGNGTSTGEISLSAFTGSTSGLCGAHI